MSGNRLSRLKILPVFNLCIDIWILIGTFLNNSFHTMVNDLWADFRPDIQNYLTTFDRAFQSL